MIKERITEDELKLYEVLRNPVLFWMLLVDYEQEDTPIENRDYPYQYQIDILTDFGNQVAIQASRASGKTFSLTKKILWLLAFDVYPGEYIVYTVPNKVHLEPVWNNLVSSFRRHPFLSHLIDKSRGLNSSSHQIQTKVGSRLLCRIAGTAGNGVNVVGLHTPCVIVDEAGFYPWGTWKELLPTLNYWQPGHQLMVSGVPTGLREKNVLFFATVESKEFNKHKFNAFDNPRYTEEQHKKDIESYGGKDSDDYIHFVLGEHGNPSFALFDRELMDIENYPVYKISLNGLKEGNDITSYISKMNLLPPVPENAVKTYIGIDLGYTEPTAIFVIWEDKKGRYRMHSKIKLTKVQYPIQQQIIYFLDTKYDPLFIAIDEGNAGKAVVQNLINNSEYKDRNYKERIIPVAFGEHVVVGYDGDKEIKQRLKIVSMEQLQNLVNNKTLVFSSTDMETINELEKMTYVKKPNGDIVFKVLGESGGIRSKGGADHFTAALLCFTFGLFSKQVLSNIKKKNRLRRRTKLVIM